MIRLCFRVEIEKRYGQKMQKFYQTSSFGIAYNSKGNVNREPLEIIVTIAKKRALLLISLVQNVEPLSKSAITSHLASMKLLVILVILCKSAHQNNSNYFSLLVAIYFYLTGVKVNAITLLNYLGLLVLYNVFLKRLRSIMSSSAAFIKQQATNYKLVGT